MDVEDGSIAGLKVITPVPFEDERGFFLRSFDTNSYAAIGIDVTAFRQHNHSRSVGPVVRGLHMRKDGSEAKLVRCTSGAILDVAVDLRPWSPTFLTVEVQRLDDQLHRQMYIPGGCAHGFQTLTPVADVQYQVTAEFDPSDEINLRWNDPAIAIAWEYTTEAIVSARDQSAPALADILPLVNSWFGAIRPTGSASIEDLAVTNDSFETSA